MIPHEPTPPEHLISPLAVSCPSGEAASMSMFAHRLQLPPSVPQYEEASSSPVSGLYVAFDPVAQYPPAAPPPWQLAPASPLMPGPDAAAAELVAK
jgi:hypothetical protein